MSSYTSAMFRAVTLVLTCMLAAPPILVARAAEPAAREALTLDQAVELVQRRSGARVVKAETVREGEQTLYRLRLLAPDGRVSAVVVHASTGTVD